jgi:hypothetical protein
MAAKPKTARIDFARWRREHADTNGYTLSSRWDDEKVKNNVIKMFTTWCVRTLVKSERVSLGIINIWNVYEHVGDVERAEEKAKLFAQQHFPGQKLTAILDYEGMIVSPKTGAFKNWSFPVRIGAGKQMMLIGLERAKKRIQKDIGE